MTKLLPNGKVLDDEHKYVLGYGHLCKERVTTGDMNCSHNQTLFNWFQNGMLQGKPAPKVPYHINELSTVV